MYYEVKYNKQDRERVLGMFADALDVFRRNYIASVYLWEPDDFRLENYRELKTTNLKKIPTDDLFSLYGSYEAEIICDKWYRDVPYEYEEAFIMPDYDI